MTQNNQDLECWKVAVDQVNQIGKRRSEVNVFFISIMSLLFTGDVFGLALSEEKILIKLVLIGMSVFGIAVCIVWICEIEAFRQITNIKYQIIHQLEDDFGGYVFRAEYAMHYASAKKSLEEIKENLSDLNLDYKTDESSVFAEKEKWIPICFIGLFGIMIIVLILYIGILNTDIIKMINCGTR